MVQNNASLSRDVRKERRAEVDECCEKAVALILQARLYYTHDSEWEDINRLSAEIKFELYWLTRKVEKLELRCPKFDVTGALVELHDSLTGGDFDIKARAKVDHEHETLRRIESDVHCLVGALEDGFDASFH